MSYDPADASLYEDTRTKASLFHDPHREANGTRRIGFRRSLADLMPPLPGLTALSGSLKTYAPSPVWRDSTTGDVQFCPLPKKQAIKLYHRARDFERRTRAPGKQDGALGRNGLAVLHAMIFDFLDFRTGQLDPAQKTIARKANICLRSVARGLVNLKLAGVLNWLALHSGSGHQRLCDPPDLAVAGLCRTARSAAAAGRHVGRSPLRDAHRP
jgi:hypothetical protein